MTKKLPAPPERTLADDVAMMEEVRRNHAEDQGDQLAIAAYIQWMKDTAAGAVLTPVGHVI